MYSKIYVPISHLVTDAHRELKSPWKCSKCKYISTRKSNVKTHALRKHSGYAEPIPVISYAGRNSSRFSRHGGADGGQTTSNFSLKSSSYVMSVVRELGGESLKAINSDQREVHLQDILQEISPQFREIERLLDSIKTPYAQKQKMLGGAVVNALNSSDPTNLMDILINDFSSMCTDKSMIDCAAAFMDCPPFIARQELIRYAAKLYCGIPADEQSSAN